MRLRPAFFLRPTEIVARELLGCLLFHRSPAGTTSLRIVETEAYLHEIDPASHSYRGETVRTQAMFGPPGHAYIYFIYGLHYCFNVVTGPVGHGAAVLIRAGQPLEGIPLMVQRRGTSAIHELCNGPAKLVEAMGISKEHNGASLMEGPLYLLPPDQATGEVIASPRIGIQQGQEHLLRYTIKDSPFLSRK